MKVLGLCFSFSVRTMASIALMSKLNGQCFYAVGVGRKIGVFNTWSECKSQIDGVKNPKFKKFNNLPEAIEFVKFWRDKPKSLNTIALDVETTQKGYSSVSDTGRTQASDSSSCEKETEDESLNVSSLQERIINCEKRIDIYVNKLNDIVSGFKEIKNEFGLISDILKNFIANRKRKLSKTSDSEPGSSKEKSSFNSPDVVDLCKDASDVLNDNVPPVIKIEDFDVSEFGECQTSAKRKRLSSDKDADNDEASKRNKKVSRGKGEKDALHFIKDEDGYVAVYTDGCCLANGCSNAKAGIGIWFGEDHPLNLGGPYVGATPTNNNAEIQAARVAIEIALKANISKLKIITDSQFLIKSVTEWIPKWKLNNWTSSTNKSVVNRVELEKLDSLMSLLSVRWEKVVGHSGVRGNEAADMLANKGADLYGKM